jgi:voltage-gated potassium channel
VRTGPGASRTAGIGGWTLLQSDAQWGLFIFCIASVVSLGICVSVGAQADSESGRARTRAWVNRKLNPGDDDSKAVDTFIIGLIGINVLLVIIETEPASVAWAPHFEVAEAVSTLIFSVEYVLRLWIAPLDPRYRHKVYGRLRYAGSPMAMVDFVAIAPFFLVFVENLDLRIARAIRLMRLVRILKMGRYAHAVTTLYQVFVRKKEELAIANFVSIMLLILCSSVIYFMEHQAQPVAFRSIPESMWWAVVTLTSVGYGDVSPITPLGKLFGAIVCMIGVLMVALPTGILASGFLEEMREQRSGSLGAGFCYCPHCGKELLPQDD